jgi:hypothetical protein
MELKTTYRKDSQGSEKAETFIPFGDERRQLNISTFKRTQGGLITTATVVQFAEDGITYSHAIGFGVCGDYNRRLFVTPQRCTAKNVKAQHEQSLAIAGDILAEAEAWYAAKRHIR